MSRLLTPFYVIGKVVKGFGRGSKELKIPTANIDTEVVQNIDLKNGIYYGFCQLESLPAPETPVPQPGDTIYPMVCSLGWNPQFNNTIRSLEVHILHQFCADFYGATLRVAICGYIRAEQKFESMDQLIDRINKDIEVGKQELKDPKLWSSVLESDFFRHQS